MKKLKFLFILSLSIKVFSKEIIDFADSLPDKEKFSEDLKKHYPDSSWVIKDFVKMKPDDFDESWDELVSIFRERPWNYYCDEETDIYDHIGYFIEQCSDYDFFLENLFIDEDVFVLGSGSQSIFNRWGNRDSMYDFYAFYFDCLSREFLDEVEDAYYSRHFRVNHYEELSRVSKRLEHSKYDHYCLQLCRYKGLLSLLEEEYAIL